MAGGPGRPSAIITLRRVFREQWRIILSITLVFFAVALVFDIKVQNTYLATARIEATRLTQDAPLLRLYQLWPSEPYAATERRLERMAQSPDVQREALRRLHPRDRLFYGGLQVVGSNSSRVNVIVPDVERGRAVRRADALASVLAERYSRQQLERLDQFIARLRRIRRGFPSGRDASLVDLIRSIPYDQLATSLETIRATARPGRVIQRASVPEDPFFSRGKLGQPAVMIGFALALVVALLADAVRRRPRDPAELAGVAEVPLLAAVPPLGHKHDRARSEAYGRTVTAVEHLTTPPPRVVLLTSPLPGEGKSSAALGLARAAAAGGRRVVLVECDLRRPALAARVGGGHRPGLLQVLRDPQLLEQALRPVAGAATSSVLAAGGTAASAAELLAAEPFAALLRELGERADLVLLDAPPVLVAADAGVLVARADAVVLCARIGRTAVDELAAARRALDRLPARPGGVIVHNVTGEAMHGPPTALPLPPKAPEQAPPVAVGAGR